MMRTLSSKLINVTVNIIFADLLFQQMFFDSLISPGPAFSEFIV